MLRVGEIEYAKLSPFGVDLINLVLLRLNIG